MNQNDLLPADKVIIKSEHEDDGESIDIVSDDWADLFGAVLTVQDVSVSNTHYSDHDIIIKLKSKLHEDWHIPLEWLERAAIGNTIETVDATLHPLRDSDVWVAENGINYVRKDGSWISKVDGEEGVMAKGWNPMGQTDPPTEQLVPQDGLALNLDPIPMVIALPEVFVDGLPFRVEMTFTPVPSTK